MHDFGWMRFVFGCGNPKVFTLHVSKPSTVCGVVVFPSTFDQELGQITIVVESVDAFVGDVRLWVAIRMSVSGDFSSLPYAE